MNSEEDNVDDIWEMIKSNKTAVLTTGAENGLHGRPMQIVQDTYQGTICFLAQSDSDPPAEVAANPEAGVTFVNDITGNYLSLSGEGRISKDERLKKELWSDDVVWLFPEGTACDSVSVIEISVTGAESRHNRRGNTKLYERFYALVQSYKSAPDLHTDLF